MTPKGRGFKVTPPRVVELLEQAVAKKSKYAVAKETGLSNSVILGLLKGNREPSTSTIQKLADYFKVPLDSLRNDSYINNSGGMSSTKPYIGEFERTWDELKKELYLKYGSVVQDFYKKIPPGEFEDVYQLVKYMRDYDLFDANEEELKCRGLLRK